MIDILKMPGSLSGGATVKPMAGSRFSGAVAVPEKFFVDGEDDMDALERFLESDEDPSAPCRVVSFDWVTK